VPEYVFVKAIRSVPMCNSVFHWLLLLFLDYSGNNNVQLVVKDLCVCECMNKLSKHLCLSLGTAIGMMVLWTIRGRTGTTGLRRRMGRTVGTWTSTLRTLTRTIRTVRTASQSVVSRIAQKVCHSACTSTMRNWQK
jgi:hypothetical protein